MVQTVHVCVWFSQGAFEEPEHFLIVRRMEVDNPSSFLKVCKVSVGLSGSSRLLMIGRVGLRCIIFLRWIFYVSLISLKLGRNTWIIASKILVLHEETSLVHLPPPRPADVIYEVALATRKKKKKRNNIAGKEHYKQERKDGEVELTEKSPEQSPPEAAEWSSRATK